MYDRCSRFVLHTLGPQFFRRPVRLRAALVFVLSIKCLIFIIIDNKVKYNLNRCYKVEF